jgi:LacI family transcriptional regulator
MTRSAERGGTPARMHPLKFGLTELENDFYNEHCPAGETPLTRRQSIKDVAKAAGVSIATVSRVMNKVDYPVSQELRDRVMQAAQALNYSPNRSAQSLRTTALDVIGLIVRGIDISHFVEIARGVTESALKYDRLAFVCNTGRDLETEYAYHELLWQHRVKGLILAGGGIRDAHYEDVVERQVRRMQDAGLRVIALAPQTIDIPCLCYDHAELGGRMTEYLLERGHRLIAFVSGPPIIATSHEHIGGYRRALERWGEGRAEPVVAYGSYNEDGGYLACGELLDRGVEFTAVCTGNDNMAIGVMHALGERGLRVPEDVSVLGVGNASAGRYVKPPLTTFDTFRYETGVAAVEYLLQKRSVAAAGEAAEELECLNPQLVERDSVREG